MFAAIALVSCEPSPTTSGPVEGRLEVRAVPLSLGPVTEVVYQVTVVGAGGQTVWTREIASTQFGDGAGAISYVGTCDPAANPNQVELSIVSMSDPNGPVSFANPAPADDPLVQLVDCQEQQDVSVTFEFTAAVAAETGFFDIAISFDDIFCSAKFDCLTEGDAPLELLFNPLTGKRETTAVMGFACTAGPGQDTYLWMDPVEILCSGGGPFDVNTAGGPGNLNPPFPGPLPDTERLLFQAAVYRGVELLDDTTSWNKAYWNVAIGLNEDAFEQLDTCILHGLASASNGDFNIGQTPPNVRWPAVQWTVPIIEGGIYTCGRYELDAGDEVKTLYTDSDGHRFYASYRAETQVLEIQVGTPDQTTVVVCADDTLLPGEQTLCVITPRQDGLLVPVEYQDFDGLSASAGTVSGVSPQELTTSFTFSFTAPATSQVVTIDTGVGATTSVTVLDAPDTTSTVTCAASLLLSGDTTICTIVAKKSGVPIYAAASAFAPSPSPDGVTGAIVEAYGASLTFPYTAGVTTGIMTISDGLGATTTLTVYAEPDQTSTVACEDDRLLPGAQTVCTVTPRAAGISIIAAASAFQVTASPDGGIGPLNPNVGTSFTFLFTAPGTVGFKTIDLGFGNAASQTQVEVYSDVDVTELSLPSEPTITDAGGQDGQIWLTWDPPADNGGSPSLVYTAVCTAVNNSGPSGQAVTAGLEVIVTGLQNGTAYTCVVFATNALGDGPPSAPTDVIIPQPVLLAPGMLVAMPLAVYGDGAFDPNVVEQVGVILSDPVVFYASRYVTPFESPDSGAVVAPPLAVYAAPEYDGGAPFVAEVGVVSPIVGAPRSFVSSFATSFGDSFTGAVVAAALGVYPRERADDADITELAVSGAVVSGPGAFASEIDAPFGRSYTGAVVAQPMAGYPIERYDDGGLLTARLVGVIQAMPAAFVAGGFDAIFGDRFSGAVVAAPVGVYGAERWDEPGLLGGERVGSLAGAPSAFTTDYDPGFGDRFSGAVVAAPVGVYTTTSYLDPALSPLHATGAVVSTPGVFEASVDMNVPTVTEPLGPPTLIDAFAQDGAIALTWEAPISDGGSPVTSYTASCDDGAVATTITVAGLSGVVSGLTNGVAYTCVVFATNGDGDGPPSAPATALVPGPLPAYTGAIVASPLSVYPATAFDPATGAATVGAIVSAPAPFFGAGTDGDLGQPFSGAVVAPPMGVYAADVFDATSTTGDERAGAIVSAPAVWRQAPAGGDAQTSGAIVAVPLGVYALSQYTDPTLHPANLVGAIATVPAVFGVEPNQTAASNQSGAVVASPLAVYGTARFVDGTAAARVGALVAPTSPFAIAADPLGTSDSGAIVASPLAVYGEARFISDLAAGAEIGALVAPAAPFVVDVADGLGDTASGAVVAHALAVYGAERAVVAILDVGAVVAAPAVFADDGTAPVPTGPPGAPTFTSAIGGDGTISLTWDPPADTGGTTALIYSVTCTATFGSHSVTVHTGGEAMDRSGFFNGTTYSCVVVASNTAGVGPPSDPVVVTPAALSDLSGAVVAAPLAVYRNATYFDAPSNEVVSAIVAAPHAFLSRFEDALGASAAGAVVAAPVGVYRATTYAPVTTLELGSGLVLAAPATFLATSAQDTIHADSGAIVAQPMAVYGGGVYAATVGEQVGTIVAPPGVFDVVEDALGESASGAVVAVPLTVYGATVYDATELLQIIQTGTVVGAPAAFAGAGTEAELGRVDSGAVVAVPMAVYSVASFEDAATLFSEASGAVVSIPAVFAVAASGHGGSSTGAVVAEPMAVYGTARFVDPAQHAARVGGIVGVPAVFLDDPALLGTGVVPATAPVIIDAWSDDASIALNWTPPSEDGGSAVIGYTATCTALDASDSGSVSTTAPTGVVTGLTNGKEYACVVVAHHAAGDGPPSDPSIVLVPGPRPASSGAVVAAPMAVGGLSRYDNPTTTALDIGPVAASPAVFTVTAATDFGAHAAGAIVARPLGVYTTARYEVAGVTRDATVGAAVAMPGVFLVQTATSAPDSSSGAVVAAPVAVYANGTWVDPVTAGSADLGPIQAAPRVYTAAQYAAGLGNQASGAIVAQVLAVYATEQYDEALGAAVTGPITAAPAVWLSEFGDQLGHATSGAIVAAAVAVVGSPYVSTVQPSGLSRADTGLVMVGFALDEVAEVRFYAPSTTTPSGLIAAGVISIDAEGALVVPVTIDPSAPLGTWQVQVVTASGYASPINPNAAQQGLGVTFTLTE